MKLTTASVVIVLAMANPTWQHPRIGGVEWNGRFYTCAEVRGWFKFLPQVVINHYLKFSTAQQRADGCACLTVKPPECRR